MSLQEKVEGDVLSGLLEELTDGLDQQYVLFGCLGGNAEAVVSQPVEIGGVADEDAVAVDEPLLELAGGKVFQVS